MSSPTLRRKKNAIVARSATAWVYRDRPPCLRLKLQVFDQADRDCKLRLQGWVFVAIRFEKTVELKDVLASAINLGWGSVSSRLDGLANGADCLVS